MGFQLSFVRYLYAVVILPERNWVTSNLGRAMIYLKACEASRYSSNPMLLMLHCLCFMNTNANSPTANKAKLPDVGTDVAPMAIIISS
jgi:hypothetical protein